MVLPSVLRVSNATPSLRALLLLTSFPAWKSQCSQSLSAWHSFCICDPFYCPVLALTFLLKIIPLSRNLFPFTVHCFHGGLDGTEHHWWHWDTGTLFAIPSSGTMACQDLLPHLLPVLEGFSTDVLIKAPKEEALIMSIRRITPTYLKKIRSAWNFPLRFPNIKQHNSDSRANEGASQIVPQVSSTSCHQCPAAPEQPSRLRHLALAGLAAVELFCGSLLHHGCNRENVLKIPAWCFEVWLISIAFTWQCSHASLIMLTCLKCMNS